MQQHYGQIRDVMVDLETLGTKPGSVILSIGAVAFNPRKPWDPMFGQPVNEVRFLSLVSLESCLDVGLRIDPGALRFWLEQEHIARKQAFAGDVPIGAALRSLSDWLYKIAPGENGESSAKIWGHGASFDPPILAAAYDKCGLPLPWKFREVRDTRTVFDMANYSYRGKHHTVIEDCLGQCEAICESYKKLGLQSV